MGAGGHQTNIRLVLPPLLARSPGEPISANFAPATLAWCLVGGERLEELNNQARVLAQVARPQNCEVAKRQLHATQHLAATPFIDHWVIQLHGIDPDQINDPTILQDHLNAIVDRLNLTRVSAHSHHFVPGVSTVIILSESHLSAHTWPELGYMHVDVVTCVPRLTYQNLEREFQQVFNPSFIHLVELEY